MKHCILSAIYETDTRLVRTIVVLASLVMALFGLMPGNTLSLPGYRFLSTLLSEHAWAGAFFFHGVVGALGLVRRRFRALGSIYGLFVYLTMYLMTIFEATVYPPMGSITGMVLFLAWLVVRDATDEGE